MFALLRTCVILINHCVLTYSEPQHLVFFVMIALFFVYGAISFHQPCPICLQAGLMRVSTLCFCPVRALLMCASGWSTWALVTCQPLPCMRSGPSGCCLLQSLTYTASAGHTHRPCTVVLFCCCADPDNPGLYVPVVMSSSGNKPARAQPSQATSTSTAQLHMPHLPTRKPTQATAHAQPSPPTAPVTAAVRPSQPPVRVIPVSVSSSGPKPGAVPVTAAQHASQGQPAATSAHLPRSNSTHIVVRPPMTVTLSSQDLKGTADEGTSTHKAAGHPRRIHVTGPSDPSHVRIATKHAGAGSTTAQQQPSAESGGSSTDQAAPHHSHTSSHSHTLSHPERPTTPPKATASRDGRDGSSGSSGRHSGSSGMTRSQAARVIQKWWRGWRVRAGDGAPGGAIHELARLNGGLCAASAKFYECLAASEGGFCCLWCLLFVGDVGDQLIGRCYTCHMVSWHVGILPPGKPALLRKGFENCLQCVFSYFVMHH